MIKQIRVCGKDSIPLLDKFIQKKDNLRIKDKEIESLPQTQTLQPEGGIIVFYLCGQLALQYNY